MLCWSGCERGGYDLHRPECASLPAPSHPTRSLTRACNERPSRTPRSGEGISSMSCPSPDCPSQQQRGAQLERYETTQTPILHSDPSSTLLLSSYSSTLLLSYSPPTTYAPMGTLGCPTTSHDTRWAANGYKASTVLYLSPSSGIRGKRSC
jgi:hypothetical protein